MNIKHIATYPGTLHDHPRASFDRRHHAVHFPVNETPVSHVAGR